MKQRIIKPEAFIKAQEEVRDGRFGAIGSDAFEVVQEETMPLNGYKEPENFPHCCEYHISLYQMRNLVTISFLIAAKATAS